MPPTRSTRCHVIVPSYSRSPGEPVGNEPPPKEKPRPGGGAEVAAGRATVGVMARAAALAHGVATRP